MPHGILQRVLRSRTTTVLLAATAILIAGGIGWERIRSSAQPPVGRPTAAPTSARSTGDLVVAPNGSRPFFTDVTEEAGLDFMHVNGARGDYWLVEEMGSGGAFFDYDDDGDMDIYLVQSGVAGTANLRHRNRLLRNDGAGRFEDVSVASGADVPGFGMGCAAADYDNDGDVDVYITRVGADVLLRNNGDGTFTDVTRPSGLGDEGFGASAAFVDYDGDGHLDLYVARYVAWSAQREQQCFDLSGVRDYCNPKVFAPTHDRLYHATGDGRFEDVSERSGVSGHGGNGLGIVCAEFTGDGWIDIFVANDQSPTFFWVNQGDGTFVEDAALRGCAFNGDGIMIAGMGTTAADFDGNGFYDVLVANIQQQVHLCLRNDGGAFEDVSYAWGFGGWGVPYTAFGVGVFDQDHDGNLDCFIGNGAVNRLEEPYQDKHPYSEPNQFARGDAAGHFTDASTAAGLNAMWFGTSRAVILGDYDNDGDVDVLVTNNGGRAQLLRNENASGNAWVALDLVPSNGSRHALNARVEVSAGGRLLRREVRPHVGYLGSNDPRVHVGLGRATSISRLSVTWPGGAVEQWSDLPVNRQVRIRQGTSPQFESVGGPGG